MSNSPVPAERPLRGSKPIARFLYGDDSPKTVRTFYNEAPHLPVFQLVPGGPFQAFPSKLQRHLEALSEAKEKAIAEAALPAAETPTAPKPAPIQSRQAPARKVAAPRKPVKSRSVAAE